VFTFDVAVPDLNAAGNAGEEPMKKVITGRRGFLKYSAALAAGAYLSGHSIAFGGSPQPSGLLKACQLGMLGKDLPNTEKLSLAKRCGFQGIETEVPADLDAAKMLGEQSHQAGVPIHSVVYGGWDAPFSDPRAEVADRGIAGMEKALRYAKAMGADVVLLVPAVVRELVGYADAWQRSQKNIRRLLPLAKELGVIIAVENVWNKFLLSPIEFARYVDEFEDPRLRAYFDVGNVILFGYSEDWIRTLGKRIVRIHLKDFKREGYKWTNLLEGDVSWRQVRKALTEVGYSGYMTTELSGGDEAYLKDLSARIDKIIAMA
jgi:L-ribulose-5-phosphate 3-epimerase